MLMVMPAIIQPAFLKDVIKIPPDFFGLSNGFLQNMSQIATLLFVGIIGVYVRQDGQKNTCHSGLCCRNRILTTCSAYQMILPLLLHIPAGFSSNVCAFLSFAPSRSE